MVAIHQLRAFAAGIRFFISVRRRFRRHLRGPRRQTRKEGARLEPEIEADRLAFSYRGLDDVVRRTEIHFAPAPVQLTASEALFKTVLDAKKDELYAFTYSFQSNSQRTVPRARDSRPR